MSQLSIYIEANTDNSENTYKYRSFMKNIKIEAKDQTFNIWINPFSFIGKSLYWETFILGLSNLPSSDTCIVSDIPSDLIKHIIKYLHGGNLINLKAEYRIDTIKLLDMWNIDMNAFAYKWLKFFIHENKEDMILHLYNKVKYLDDIDNIMNKLLSWKDTHWSFINIETLALFIDIMKDTNEALIYLELMFKREDIINTVFTFIANKPHIEKISQYHSVLPLIGIDICQNTEVLAMGIKKLLEGTIDTNYVTKPLFKQFYHCCQTFNINSSDNLYKLCNLVVPTYSYERRNLDVLKIIDTCLKDNTHSYMKYIDSKYIILFK